MEPWATGKRLRSNIDLHLENISITGEGIFDGGGDSWRPIKKEKTTAAQWKNLLASGGVLNKEENIWWPSNSR